MKIYITKRHNMKTFTKALFFTFLLIGFTRVGVGQVFITELADPNNNDGARFVELYNAGGSDVDLSTGWDLQRWTNGNVAPQTAVELTGTILAGGFYIICANQTTFTSTYGFAADQNIGIGGPADSNGDDQIALRDPSDAIIDMFGVAGEDGSGTNHEFEDGRAERKATVTSANSIYTFSEWNIWNDTGAAGTTNDPQDAPADFDPGSWIGASSGPTITLSETFLTGFTYVEGSGPSAEQSFTVEGSNLTDDIIVTPPPNWEISTGTGGSFVAKDPITLTETGGTVSTTPIYTRMVSGLTNAGSPYSENIACTSTGATTKNVAVDGEVFKQEPTNHPTAFACGTTTSNTIPLTWTDAGGAVLPDNYLIKWSDVSYADITAPVDGTEETDGAGVYNATQGDEAYTTTGLSSNKTYYFKIWAYTNSGTNIDYKTDETVEQTSCATTNPPCIDESFESGQPAGWTENGSYFNTGTAHSGTEKAGMNSTGDWIRTTQETNPVQLSFWIRASGSSSDFTMVVESSSDGSSWSIEDSYSADGSNGGTITDTYNQKMIDLSLNGDYYIRFRISARSGGSVYLDDVQINCGPGNDFDSEVYAPISQVSGVSIASTNTAFTDAFKFVIQDQSSGDGVNTIVTNVRIYPHTSNTADWTNTIQSVKLNDGSDINLGTVTITDTYIDINIPSGNLVTLDDGTEKEVTFSFQINSTNLTDNSVVSFFIDADVHGFTTDAVGSGFIDTFTLGDFNSNDFIIEVTATELKYIQQPVDTEINEIMNPSVTIEAIDANGNRDTDNSSLVNLISSGTMNSVTDITLSGGFGTFGNIVHTVSGTDFILTASAFALTNAVSNLFEIILINYVSGDYRTLNSGNWSDNTADGVWAYYNGSSWENTHNSPNFNTSATIYIRSGHTITTGGSFGNSVNINVSGGEFIVNHPSTAATVVVRSGNFTVNSSTAFTIPSTGSVTVNKKGVFNLNSSSVTINFGAVFTIESGGRLKLNNNALRNDNSFFSGTEDFQDGSFVELLDWDWSASATYRSLINIDTDITDNAEGYKFGNFILNSVLANNWTIIGGSIGIIELCYNDFIINNNTSFYVSGASNKNGINGYIINGNLIVNSGNFSFGSSYTNDPFNHQFTINGNFEYNGSNDLKLHRNSSGTATELNGKVTFNRDVTINTGTDFTLDVPSDNTKLMVIEFAGNSNQEINIARTVKNISMNVKSSASVQLVSENLVLNSSAGVTNSLKIENGGTLNFGWADDGTTPLIIDLVASPSGTNTFTSEQGSTLKITHPEGLSKTALTGNVQLSTSNITYNQTAVFHYIGKANQETGDGITSGSTGKIIIVELADNTIELGLTNSSGISNGTDIHASGGRLDVRKGILRETASEYLSGSGSITMTDGKYIIPLSSQDASDLIPRLIGASFEYNLTGGLIELSSNESYDGSSVFGQILRGARDYYSLTFSGGGDKRVSSSVTNIDGIVLIENDNTELDVENNEFSGTGNLTMTDNSLFRMSSLNNTLPELTGIYTLTGGTLEIYGSDDTETHSIRGTDGSKGTITYNNIELNADVANIAYQEANVVTSSGFNVNGTMNVNSPVCFKIGASYHIDGTGTFDLKSGATLKFGSPDGIALSGAAGNIRTAVRTFSTGASYGFTGTVSSQVSGNALPSNIDSLFIEKTDVTDTVILGTVQINGDMILREGILQINADMNTPVICDNGSAAGNVSIESGSSLEILPDKALTVEGTITNSVGVSGLVLKSDTSGTGSLIEANAVVATCERYLNANNWNYIFTPLSNVNGTSILTGNGEEGYSYNEAPADYWDATTIYGTSGWVSGIDNSMSLSKGYIHRVTTNTTYSLTGGNLEAGDKTFTLSYTDSGTGVPSGGEVTADWDEFEGWNFFGNPYTSAIDWDYATGWDKSEIENFVYYYDGSNYQCYGTSPYDQGITQNNGTQYIPANQGFFVKAKSTGNGSDFKIPKAARVHDSQAFWKKTDDLIPNFLRMNIKKDDFTDEMIVRTLPAESGVTEGHDDVYDAYKMFSLDISKPQIYSQTDNGSNICAVNSIPEFVNDKIIPLGLYIGGSGEYSINLTENNFDNMHTVLEDRLLGEYINLRMNPEYKFNYVAENNDNRFFLHFDLNDNPILNNEIPNQEVNVNDYFDYVIPQETFIDTDFEDELTITANLESDENLPEWLTFDSDLNQFYGTPAETQILNIKVTATDVFGASVSDVYTLTVKSSSSVTDYTDGMIQIFPNPAKDKLNIVVSDFKGKGEIAIFDITGKKILSNEVINKTDVLDIRFLTKGIYIIEIRYQDRIFKKRLIKE